MGSTKDRDHAAEQPSPERQAYPAEQDLERYRRRAAARRAKPAPTARLASERGVAVLSSAVAAAAVGGSADAAILYSGVQNIERSVPAGGSYSTRAGASLDLDFDGSDDLRVVLSYSSEYGTRGYMDALPAGLELLTDGPAFPAGRWARAFAPGEAIPESGPANRSALLTYRLYYPAPAPFLAPDPDIAAFRFNGRLGWIRLVFGDGETRLSMRVVDWAIESEPGVPINAGAVPEPSSGVLTGLGLLALGARGVRARRARCEEAETRCGSGDAHA